MWMPLFEVEVGVFEGAGGRPCATGGIDPVPLEPPQSVPPPSELAGLHFNEWTLAYRTCAQ